MSAILNLLEFATVIGCKEGPAADPAGKARQGKVSLGMRERIGKGAKPFISAASLYAYATEEGPTMGRNRRGRIAEKKGLVGTV